jgi:hypothetical protein
VLVVGKGNGGVGGTVVRAAFLVGLVAGYVKDFALFSIKGGSVSLVGYFSTRLEARGGPEEEEGRDEARSMGWERGTLIAT